MVAFIQFAANTSSVVLATISKPMYEKKTVAEPANNPFAPKAKYLETQRDASIQRLVVCNTVKPYKKNHLPARNFIAWPASLTSQVCTS